MHPSVSHRIEPIQALRAFAALLVALGHMLQESAVMPGGVEQAPSLFLVWTGAGVDIFFVISGFVMVHAARPLFMAPDGGRIFLLRRLARIVPLYWLTTTLFLAVMLAAPSALSSAMPSLSEILKSYLFIPYERGDQTLMQPVYKLGWTLNYEMFFYVIFAAMLALAVRRAVAAMALLFAAIVAAGQIAMPGSAPLKFWSDPIILEFVWGALIALLLQDGAGRSRRVALLLIAAGFAGFGFWAFSGVDPFGPWRPFVWGACAAAIVAGAALLPQQTGGAGGRLMVRLGDASYAIYLLHPMAIRALRILWDKTGLTATVPGTAFIAAGMILTVAFSLLVFRWFEKPVTLALQRFFGAEGQRVIRRPPARVSTPVQAR